MEARENTWIIIISSTLFAPSEVVLPGERGFIFRTSVHVCISFILFCVFNFKWCVHWSSAIIPHRFFFFLSFSCSLLLWFGKFSFFSPIFLENKFKFLLLNFQERALPCIWTTGSQGVQTSLESLREASARSLFSWGTEGFPGEKELLSPHLSSSLHHFFSRILLREEQVTHNELWQL